MKKLKLIDLFCGAGGCSVGYHRAGFEVVGVDNKPQKNYPFKFIQADALSIDLSSYDMVHASPPCQRFSISTPNPGKHPNLISATRDVLIKSGKPYVIENVPHAPITPDIILEGGLFGLDKIKRKRHFETHPPIFKLRPKIVYPGPVISVTGHGTTSGNRTTWGRNIKVAEMRQAMGIDWMNRDELSQAIPPAYTEYIGKIFMAEVFNQKA